MATTETLQQAVARNAKALREGRDLSQRALAERMRRRGYDWGDTIVSRVERGERDLSLDEIVVLALILGGTLQDLLRPRGAAVDVGGVPIDVKMWTPWVAGRGVLQIADDNSLRLDTDLLAAVHPELFQGGGGS